MQHWASQQKENRQELNEVGAMLRQQEVCRDEQERPKHPPAVTASRGEATVVRVVGHGEVDPVVLRPAIQPNSAPRPNDQAIITTSA
jgi:hypothetical protein